jgi:beta-glucosidase
MKCQQKFYNFPLLPLLSLIGALSIGYAASAADFPENDPRIDVLLSQMTLDEKVGQMVQADMMALTDKNDVTKYFIGSVLSGGNSDPADNRPETWLQAVNEYKSLALQTRLKIPLLYGIDAVHGHNNILGAVIFPHHVGLGATHDPKLIQAAEHVSALEVAGTGIQWAFDPCLAVSQDIRWGRSYESFGQSPRLVSQLGAAAILGWQGNTLSPASVLACAKHFAGDGGTENGTNAGNVVCDEATFRKLYLPPYQAAIKAGVRSMMVSFSSWNGVKMHANKHLLTDVLKGEMGYQGFLVSDWAAIDQIAPDYKNDIETSINAGLDMVMIPYGPGSKNNYVDFITDLKDLVNSGAVPIARIDDAVRRILRVKYQMGLFDNPRTDPTLTQAIGCDEHRQVARQCVRESLVLLKNTHHTLPLSKDIKHLAVVGKAADDLGIQCGGWTIDWQGKPGNVTPGGTTLLAAIKKAVTAHTEVTYSTEATNLSDADAIIVVVGELPYAEGAGDRTDVRLSAADSALVATAKGAGVPVITVLYSGRPMLLDSVLDESDAFVAAWLPGTEGEGMTDALFGITKFTGKLPRVWPRNSEQYSAQTAVGRPLFRDGFGLTD